MLRFVQRLQPFAAILLLLAITSTAAACPFCSAVSQTFSEEITASEVAVFAKLVELPARPEQPAVQIDINAAPPKAKFEITEIIKGESQLSKAKQIEVLYFGEAKVGTEFLIMGIEPPVVVWSTPIEMTPRGRQYVGKLLTLPKEGPDRLAFFQEYLEDQEEMLTRDAYDEFAKSPYPVVKGLKDRMKHDQLIAWIWDSAIPASRKRLYLTMLSVCGDQNDLLMLETILKAEDRQVKLGLDAAIACYLTLKGSDGVALVEDLFFKKKDAEYTDTHAAIMALRFHAQEGDVIPKDRIKLAFRHMLDQPKLADLIIPDLARMEDWEVLDKMVALFKEANAESSWVRVPIVNYLRACPLPEAKTAIDELAKIDPASVQHANSFYPLTAGPEAASRAGAQEAKNAAPAGDTTSAASESTSETPAGESTETASAVDDPGFTPPVPEVDPQSGLGPTAPVVTPSAQVAQVSFSKSTPEIADDAQTSASPQLSQAVAPDNSSATAQSGEEKLEDRAERRNLGGILTTAVPLTIGALVLLIWSISRGLRA